MNPINRLNLLLSDILQTEPIATHHVDQGSTTQTYPQLTFAEHDCHSSSISPSITATPSVAPLPPRRNHTSVRQRRQRHQLQQSDMHKQQQQQQQQQTQPLLNSSTLDDLFRALTLECEQYLTASSASTHSTQAYDKSPTRPSPVTRANIDSNDDDYENLHSSNRLLSNGHSPLKTSIQVISPQKRQILAVNVSSKLSPTPLVTSSRTYPLLSASCTTTSNAPAMVCRSSEDDSFGLSSSSANRRPPHRRRRTRRQQTITAIAQSSSSDEERTDPLNEKKLSLSKRSCSTDHRQQRTKSIYDNQPIFLPTQRGSVRRATRRRDVSLQQHSSNPSRPSNNAPLRFPEHLCSPLSVLLTSARSTSDFVDRAQPSRQSRVPLITNRPPLTLLDRMHQQFYQSSAARSNQHSIPTHRIPSYPVY